MENRSHALLAGLFVLLLSLAAVGAAWFFSGRTEATNIYLLETRKAVSGLNMQAQVRYRGIRAGRVRNIAPDPQDPRLLLVEIGLDARFRLTKATTAQLGYQGVTGLAFVQLDDDGSSREYLDTEGAVPPRIALRPSFVESLGERAGDIAGGMAELAVRLNRVLDEKNAAHLARTLENLAAASEGLRQVPQLVAALRGTLSEANLKRLERILAHAEQTAGAAPALVADGREALRALTALSQKVDRLATTLGNDVGEGTLPQVNALVRELNGDARRLARVLDMLEDNPQALVFGKGKPRPGPGEAGFVAPAAQEK